MSGGRGPLAGVTVIELAGIGPCPFAGLLLAELGARVILVERPAGPGGGLPRIDLLHRGKESVELDLKSPDGLAAVLALAARADVLIEGYRPGVAERLGLGPQALAERNPALVYGRMTGWGQDGPLADRAGHDVTYLALTGALHAIGPAGGAPQIPLNLVGDFGGGSTYLVIGVLAALLEARRTGRGQVVDAAIVDGAAHLLGAVHGLMALGGWRDQRGVNALDGGAPYYAVYRTADAQYVAVGAIEPQFYVELLRLLAIPADVVDPLRQNDPRTWAATKEALAAAFAAGTREHWTTLFAGTDACVAPVLGLREAADHPHVAARGSLVVRDGVLQAGPAPRLSGHPDREPRTAPTPGEHTAAVLAELGE